MAPTQCRVQLPSPARGERGRGRGKRQPRSPDAIRERNRLHSSDCIPATAAHRNRRVRHAHRSPRATQPEPATSTLRRCARRTLQGTACFFCAHGCPLPDGESGYVAPTHCSVQLPSPARGRGAGGEGSANHVARMQSGNGTACTPRIASGLPPRTETVGCHAHRNPRPPPTRARHIYPPPVRAAHPTRARPGAAWRWPRRSAPRARRRSPAPARHARPPACWRTPASTR